MLLIISTACAYILRSPFVFPMVVVFGGMVTALSRYNRQAKEQPEPFKIEWANFLLYIRGYAGHSLGILVVGIDNTPLWVRLFENFYRNGSFIFGGGQVLIPVLFTEFVEFKAYLTEQEFLSGFGLAQCVPGPVFSFVSFIGVLSMRGSGAGLWGEIWGSTHCCGRYFLTWHFSYLFVIRFWEQLKKYRIVKSFARRYSCCPVSGLVVAAALLLFIPISGSVLNVSLVVGSFLILTFTKIKPPWIILCGLLAGFIF